MGSLRASEKPHAVCIPYPAQGHINPMLKLAKLLHFHGGFHITFVNTEFNHRRLLKSRGSDSLNGLSSFRFETIPDGFPNSSDATITDATQDIPSLCESTRRTCLAPFTDLIKKLNNSPHIPPVTCIVSDGVMSFTVDAAKQLGIPDVLFWTTSACGFICYVHYRQLIDKGLTPLKDPSDLTNGYLDNTVIDWIPGIKPIRLRDMPSFIRTTNPEEFMLDFILGECERAKKACAIILNTFDALEHDVLQELSSILPPIYSIGPLNLFTNQITDEDLNRIGSNLWKEDLECLRWPQEQVLAHPSVGGFLTHSGWNSTIESICGGVAMICWPFFAEQQTNCRFACTEWGIGLEIESDVKRGGVERLVRELMEGEKGKEMKKKALEWKKMAEEATSGSGGSSFQNFQTMIRQILPKTVTN
ncbi:hypothetical protein K1719_036809 [Acacia pycnantha]|nr:hypothetical protein K1719_036809 [Acacia pycnantha]